MIQNISKDKILEVVKQGPTLPNKIVKQVGGDTVLIGAILSTLISTGSVLYTNLKVGGSPLYYIPGHEEKLEDFISTLNEKDQKSVRLLKEKRVLRDSELDPLVRVSLRAVKDFARQFEMESAGNKEIFWRYYLVNKDEASKLASELLSKPAPSEISAAPAQQQAPAPQPVAAAPVKQESAKPIAVETASPVAPSAQAAPIQELHDHKHRTGHAQHPPITHKHTVHKKTDAEESHEQKIEDIRSAPQESTKEKSEFLDIIRSHAHSMNLDMISKEKIKKTEYALVLKNHDSNEYIYCMAKDKKTVNEGDLAAAYVYAQSKKMPCIFMTTGKLTKKAESMLEKEFKDMRIEHIDVLKY